MNRKKSAAKGSTRAHGASKGRKARPFVPPPTADALSRLEHLRDGFILLPPPDASHDFVTASIPAGSRPRAPGCTCGQDGCPHRREISALIFQYERTLGASARDAFEASLWHGIGTRLATADAVPRDGIRLGEREVDGRRYVCITSAGDRELGRYHSTGPDDARLRERLGSVEKGGALRARMLSLLEDEQETFEERVMNRRGFATKGQLAERSFWMRLMYHAFRELADCRHRVEVEPGADACGAALVCRSGVDSELRVWLPRDAVVPILDLLAAHAPDDPTLRIADGEGAWRFTVAAGKDPAQVEVQPGIELTLDDGASARLYGKELDRCRFGRCVYLVEHARWARLPAGPMVLTSWTADRARLPDLLDELQAKHGASAVDVDSSLGSTRIFKHLEGLELDHASTGRDWTWLDLRYRFGVGSVSLQQILAARSRKRRYLATAHGWVDLEAAGFDRLDALAPEPPASTPSPSQSSPALPNAGLNTAQLLMLQALAPAPIEVVGEGSQRQRLADLLDLKPTAPYRQPELLLTSLRAYQERGVDWLRFLWQNGLSGLLCDDMGLGKTHQTMALMASLRELEGVERPFLVVCPRTVLSHWLDKLTAHAPGLRATIHHGSDRDLTRALATSDVILTSYGVLRRDAEELAQVHFAVCVFDEIQHLKNRETRGHRGARQLNADLRLGLTGTPVENSVNDLKALFDVVLPGYLGTDERFRTRYLAAEQGSQGRARLVELHRITSPFVLRRLKSAVLDELPDKIEDLRTCELSEEQAGLYREALKTRGLPLLEKLRIGDSPIPYVHIFALIGLLKQICDHPALALDRLEHAEDHTSGKWELFTELLDESLGSGLKVVVFSQYLGMLELMERHLKSAGVAHVKLTGKSRKRGELIRRFNEDDDCRVFLGSLLAGGTGIDLIGGSVVIHYDRWWNAAREEQATDRVHRMGQKRVVQVFKLMTMGTLEERIEAVIARKKELASAVIQADDPKLHKLFDRDELLELLSPV